MLVQQVNASPRKLTRAPMSQPILLKTSANNRYVVDQNNVPFMIVRDSPHSLIGRMSQSDAKFQTGFYGGGELRVRAQSQHRRRLPCEPPTTGILDDAVRCHGAAVWECLYLETSHWLVIELAVEAFRLYQGVDYIERGMTIPIERERNSALHAVQLDTFVRPHWQKPVQ